MTDTVKTIKLQTAFGLRRFSLPVTDASFFLPLQAAVLQHVACTAEQQLLLTYVDEDEDVITIANDSDVAEAWRVAESSARGILRLRATVTGDLPAVAAATAATAAADVEADGGAEEEKEGIVEDVSDDEAESDDEEEEDDAEHDGSEDDEEESDVRRQARLLAESFGLPPLPEELLSVVDSEEGTAAVEALQAQLAAGVPLPLAALSVASQPGTTALLTRLMEAACEARDEGGSEEEAEDGEHDSSHARTRPAAFCGTFCDVPLPSSGFAGGAYGGSPFASPFGGLRFASAPHLGHLFRAARRQRRSRRQQACAAAVAAAAAARAKKREEEAAAAASPFDGEDAELQRALLASLTAGVEA